MQRKIITTGRATCPTRLRARRRNIKKYTGGWSANIGEK